MMIFIEIDGYILSLKNISGIHIRFGKIFLVDGNLLTFKPENVQKLAETLKNIYGETWITV